MRIEIMLAGIAWLFLGPAVPLLRADGGTIRVSEQRGRYRVTVFTQPTPCRVGPVDVSVLVQDAATGNPLTADVTVQLDASAGPRRTLRATATTAAATNKLLHSATFDVPAAGRWRGEATVRHGAGTVTSAFELDVEEALPPWRSFGLWIGAPAVVIVVFAVHQVLAALLKK